MFEKKSLADIHGDGRVMTVTVKVPLSQTTVGSYDASEILSDDSLDSKRHGPLRAIWNEFKYSVMNIAVNIGISNKVKYSFDYEFPEIDPEIVKSIRVKRIFFALENCHEEDEQCILREKKRPVTFKFLDSFFMNVSVVMPGDDLDLDNQEIGVDPKVWEQASEMAFASTPKNFFSYVDDHGNINEDLFKNVNLARFRNTRSYRKDPEVAGKLGKVFLLRLGNHLSKGEKNDLIKRFKGPQYKEVVKGFSLIGSNVYLELEDIALKDRFFKILSADVGSVEELGNNSFDQCSQLNCADLKTNSSNLVPMLEKSNHIRFDTYLSLDKVEQSDFRYNGFVELEVKIDPGF